MGGGARQGERCETCSACIYDDSIVFGQLSWTPRDVQEFSELYKLVSEPSFPFFCDLPAILRALPFCQANRMMHTLVKCVKTFLLNGLVSRESASSSPE